MCSPKCNTCVGQLADAATNTTTTPGAVVELLSRKRKVSTMPSIILLRDSFFEVELTMKLNRLDTDVPTNRIIAQDP